MGFQKRLLFAGGGETFTAMNLNSHEGVRQQLRRPEI